ncbi:MAG TPA: Hsp20/alpha crystallin family protein [Gemmatimonadales bacterium]|nr:Hsp20/alpha crystallin family protein [Gemmatimonadales bacterium]
MPLIRFRDPSRDLTDLQTQMNQIFDHALGQSAGMMDRSWAPPADMGETPDELIVYVDLPGLSEKDIRVAITGDLLMIQGERPLREPNQEASHYRRERWFGKFERTFALSIPVEAGRIRATYRDGVLIVRLPKAEGVKPKEIKIQAE